ncbi:hypothetical protein ACFLRW_02860 [Acidobacteriota bacterium]
MPTKDELNTIFDELKNILKKYSPPFSVKTPSEALKKKRSFELTSYKKVVIAGRKKDEVYFAGIIIQKDYVGFYYMLAYAEPYTNDQWNMKDQLSPKFLSLLKGKTCFYIRNTEEDILNEVKKALDIGVKKYKEWGWV